MKSAIVVCLILFLASFAGAQKSVLFLVGAGQEATGPEESDDIVLDVLESFEWDVETYYLDDPSKMTDSLGLDKDLVVISSTINSAHIGEFYYDKAVPILTWEQGMYGKLGIATGGGIITTFEIMMTIVEEGHPAVGDYTGAVEVLFNSPMELTLTDTSQYSQNLLPLTEMMTDEGLPLTAIFAIEEGATLLDTTAAPARRIGFFFRDKTAIDATEDALAILGLCCKWAIGEEESSVDDLRQHIADYQLMENYPNPFNPSTTISFDVPKAAEVTLAIYNNLGSKVRTLTAGFMSAGHHSLQWNGRDDGGNLLPSGVYYYELASNHGVIRNKMLLVK